MANVYCIENDGTTAIAQRIWCKSEGQELQRILEKNHDLLPGDQIDPEEPRRWLLIKREMPVPDPSTGKDNWSIDFLFADQDAIPTFVECKRFLDTRSRREVVGQMLDYAANGRHYWDRDILRNYAGETYKANKANNGITTIEDLFENKHFSDDSIEVYFERLQKNLYEGQIRIIFFMEESPYELRSIVDFLNRQMERSEVLLVEARQYLICNGTKIVIPTLFGYTEEARRVKKEFTELSASKRKKWNEQSFFDALTPEHAEAISAFYKSALALSLKITWGTGQVHGSLSIKETSIGSASIISIFTTGALVVNFGNIPEAPGKRLKLSLENIQLTFPENSMYPSVPFSSWKEKKDKLLEVLKQLVSEFRAQE